MKPLVVALTAVLASTAAFADHDRDDRHWEDHGRPGSAQVVVDRQEMAERLERLQKLLDETYERLDEGHGKGKLRRAMDEVDGLRRVVRMAPDARAYPSQPPPVVVQQPPPPPPAPVVQPVDNQRLNMLTQAMVREAFPKDKLRVLSDFASRNNYFLVSQVRQLMDQFSFANDKLEAVRMMWPRVLDRDNGFQLYQAFPFSNDKAKLKQIIGG
jgi:hypothetical protein